MPGNNNFVVAKLSINFRIMVCLCGVVCLRARVFWVMVVMWDGSPAALSRDRSLGRDEERGARRLMVDAMVLAKNVLWLLLLLSTAVWASLGLYFIVAV